MTKSYEFSFRDPKNCPLYNLIKDGVKTVEGRKNSPGYQKIEIGDKLYLNDTKGILELEVTYINKYNTVKDYLEGETVEKALPCVNTVGDGIKIYESFVPESDIKQLKEKYGHGFLGIGIKFIKEHKRHNMGLKEPWFSHIKNGRKLAEGRLDVGLPSRIKVGDIIKFMNRDRSYDVVVTGRTKYDTFREMLENEGLEKVLPGIGSIDEGVGVYRQYFKEDAEKKFGVIAIKMKVKRRDDTLDKILDGGYKKKYIKYKKKYLDLKREKSKRKY